MKHIPLTQGAVAIVDDEDYEFLTAIGSWYLSDTGYAFNRGPWQGDKQTLRMHRIVNDTPRGLETDHINRNRLDNRKANLRSVTHSENMENQRICKAEINQHGVIFARFYHNNKRYYCGVVDSIEEALHIRGSIKNQLLKGGYQH